MLLFTYILLCFVYVFVELLMDEFGLRSVMCSPGYTFTWCRVQQKFLKRQNKMCIFLLNILHKNKEGNFIFLPCLSGAPSILT